MTPLPLTRWQSRRLQRQLKATHDARIYRRTLAVLQASHGQPIAQIARMLGVTRQSVHNWIESYTHSYDPGDLFDEGRSGRPSLWTEDLRALLRRLFEQAPDQLGYFAVNWTIPLLQEHIEHGSGQWLADDTIRRELARLGYVWKRSR
jgi:transposase